MHRRLPSVLPPPLVGLKHGVEDEGEDGDGGRQEDQEQEDAAQVDHHEHVDARTHHCLRGVLVHFHFYPVWFLLSPFLVSPQVFRLKKF